MNADAARWLPLLVHIQANLDGALDLASLAERSALSPSHLQRAFKRALGETPKACVERLRLERAAFLMQIQDSSLLQLALDCGFHNAETFTRAFERRFGQAPSAWRAQRRRVRWRDAAPQRHAAAEGSHAAAAGYALSATRVRRQRALHLAFVRHLGPYESVPDSLFEELRRWAARHRIAGPPIWLGIGHDAPGTTPPSRLRFDAALVLPAPVAPSGRIAYQLLPAGDFAVTTHVGPFSTLPAAYAEVFPRLLKLPGWLPVGLPAVEIYRSESIDATLPTNQTEICLPVQRLGG